MSTAKVLTRVLPALAFAVIGTGCVTMPRSNDAMYAPTLPVAQTAPPPADGAIYHAATSMELFNDPRAHRVGDILTINLVESTAASKKASTKTSKSDSVGIDAPSIYGHTWPKTGTSLANLGSKNSFNGQGESSQSNSLTGQLTVTVAQRLSNGNLVVRGEKWLTINQGQELVRIAGIVRPQDISPDNTIQSTRVADARITYSGRGTLADANSQGWLARFFNSKWMPF
ncbi:flagellar basal body L-ring protein FlgH [Oleiagrimonas sp. C23AA]|uniref:flagellar basal body L-ring protein FlgH n=1 Tax=Oleiagrimonas sp. C23AA TaxID=2719047 RepID=UPI001421A169|nr:flagellar basal body L-ring protein FlgH [Oleiagrimonas sp. C23AA]NII09208.1 flagellar basal body L-ring protein FlgH [Oleiagrimonas sp. C23AA]